MDPVISGLIGTLLGGILTMTASFITSSRRRALERASRTRQEVVPVAARVLTQAHRCSRAMVGNALRTQSGHHQEAFKYLQDFTEAQEAFENAADELELLQPEVEGSLTALREKVSLGQGPAPNLGRAGTHTYTESYQRVRAKFIADLREILPN